MTTGIKTLISFCFAAFLFSGCFGVNTNNSPEIKEKESLQQTESSTIPSSRSIETKNVVEPDKEKKSLVSLKTDPPEETRPISEPKIDQKPEPESKKVVESSRSSRFEEAKKEINTHPVKSVKKKTAAPGDISFNFDNADLYEVIRTMADILEISYIVDPNIRGKVTIHTAGTIDTADLFPLFFQILELNGLSAVKEGDLYKIINKSKISNTPMVSGYGRELNKISGNERLVMQIVPLEFVSVGEIAKTITPFLSESGTILPYDESDIFIVIDKSDNLKRILQLVDLFDIDFFDKIDHRFFRLKHIEAKEVAGLLKAMISPYLGKNETAYEIITIERLNTLVAISADNRLLDLIAMFIDKIDLGESSAGSRIFVYKVKNSKAEDLAFLLHQLFREKAPDALPGQKQKTEAGTKPEKNNAPPPIFTDYVKKDQTLKSPQAGFAGSDSLRGDIKIISDNTRNALIIEAAPADYQSIQRILKEIDILPRQVLINVMIVDVTLTKGMELGVEWAFIKGLQGPTGLLNLSAGKKGLNFTAGLSKEWVAALNALASEDKADILSSPSLLASDNEPATINVGTQIPIATSTFDSESGVTSTTVQYRDTGIILTVTPYINDYGLVTMEISQEVSNQADSSADADNPSFFTRSVNTTLTVADGQTIVIGGLISETVTDVESGVPVLMDIPVLGALFKNKKEKTIKNELIIFITPRVIKTPDDIDYVSREFFQKINGLKDSQRLKNPFSDK